MPTLLGNRIYLNLPKKEETKVIVDHNTEEDLKKEMLKKMSKLTIHSLGTSITEPKLKVGAEVLIDPIALTKAPIIHLSDIEDVLLVSPFDIIMVWD
jgi:hypothetical protein